MEGIAEGMRGQVDQLATQMARPKVVEYDTEGNPIRVVSE